MVAFSQSSSAKMYDAQIDIHPDEEDLNPDAIELFNRIDSELTAYDCLKKIGTHLIWRATFGAK